MASTRSIPSARASSTGFPTNTPTNKTAGRGQEDFMGRKISPAAGSRDQKPAILPPKGGTTNSKKPARPSPKNLPTNKIFLPHIPRLGAGVFHSSKSHRPARPGPAQPFSRLIKPPIAGRKIVWVGHHPSAPPFADGISGKKMGGKRGGLLFSALLTRALTGCPQIQDSADF